MQEATMNFIFALVVGKSVKSNLKGKNALNNMWDCEFYLDLFIGMCLSNHRYKEMLRSMTTRTKPKVINY